MRDTPLKCLIGIIYYVVLLVTISPAQAFLQASLFTAGLFAIVKLTKAGSLHSSFRWFLRYPRRTSFLVAINLLFAITSLQKASHPTMVMVSIPIMVLWVWLFLSVSTFLDERRREKHRTQAEH